MMDHITASLTLAPAVGMHQERDVLKRPRYWDGFLLDFGADPPLVEQGNELLVKQHRLYQLETRLKGGSIWQDKGLVFANNSGNYIDPMMLHRDFDKLLRDARLPDIRFHDLRHSAATMLLAMGINPKVVQERLGHSHISITLGIYAHVLPSMQREAAEKIHDLFRKSDQEDDHEQTMS